MRSGAIAELRAYLESCGSGAVPRRDVLHLLMEAWPHLGAEQEQSTWGSKLGRVENLVWAPPVLSFDLERHGATVLGSTRAEVHSWEVNVADGSAAIVSVRRRQVKKQAARLDVGALVEEIEVAIDRGEDDERLSWSGDVVKVNIGRVIPATNKQTTEGRRRRFRTAFDDRVTERGWTKVGQWTYDTSAGR